MANTFETNKKVDLVALRAAESAAYLTVGSKKYFSDQLSGKRNGTTYGFVIRDAGEYVTGMSLNGASNLKERIVNKDIKLGNIVIDTNLLEKYTDINTWDKEIAEPNGRKLVEGVVKETIESDIGLQNVAFVGQGWLPLSKASRFLGSVSSEKKYGFIDPMIDSVMVAGGKSFTPTESEDLYHKGVLGSFAGSEWREQQFLPSIVISDALAGQLATATVTSYVTAVSGDTLTLAGVTEKIPAGTPIQVAGCYACNLVGNATSTPKAFIAIEDAVSGVVKVRHVDFDGEGTKECNAAPAASAKLVNPIGAGTYYMGIVRVDGAMEFDTLPKLDWSNADESSDNVEGITVHEGRAIDILAGSNKTRWTVASLAGIVETRGVALVLIKDAIANMMTM